MLYIVNKGIIFITTNQGVFMAIKNTLTKMAALLLFLMPLMTVAAAENKIDPYAKAKEEPKEEEKIPVMKLIDIKNGKHSKAEQKNSKKLSSPKIVKKQPSSNSSKQTEKKIRKKEKPKKVTKVGSKEKLKKVTKIASKEKPKQKEAPAPEAEQKKEIEIDLMEAYSAVMGTANKKAIKKDTAKVKATPSAAKASESQSVSPSNTIGWLYLGKFTQGQWARKGNQVLGLKGVLPKINQFYSLRVHSNIRKGKPSKGKMPKVIKQLSNGSKVKLLAVHNSGNSGHYWARIKW